MYTLKHANKCVGLIVVRIPQGFCTDFTFPDLGQIAKFAIIGSTRHKWLIPRRAHNPLWKDGALWRSQLNRLLLWQRRWQKSHSMSSAVDVSCAKSSLDPVAAGRDSSVGRVSGFGPWGPGFKSCLCQSSQKWHWVVTPAIASPYQGIKLGPELVLGIQRWLWESLHASESRAYVMMDPLWLWNPWAEATKIRNRVYQWLHKMVTCYRKKIYIKKLRSNIKLLTLWFRYDKSIRLYLPTKNQP